MTTTDQVKNNAKQEDKVRALRNSLVHGLVPISEDPETILVDDVETDLTNPGSVTESRRYERRHDSMLDSYDILDRVVYPIVVCQHPEQPGKYIHIDGYGRLGMLKGKGVKTVRALIYPPMDLEQRICLRQTLNAAQEPFDAVSIIHDLRLLAKERGLSLQSRADVKTLVRDLPARVQDREKDLLLLTRWHPDVVSKMGEQYGPNQEVIGVDQLRSLTRLLDAMLKQHPLIVEKTGGESEVTKMLAQAFYHHKFADGMRSQEGIRKAIKATKLLPENHPAVDEFLSGEIGIKALMRQGDEAQDDQDSTSNQNTTITSACQRLTSMLIEVDADSLSDGELRSLERTLRVLESVVPPQG